jgi:integrase
MTRKLTSASVTDRIAANGKAVKTQKDEVANLTAWGEWLTLTGHLEHNPFAGLTKLIKASSKGRARSKKRPYTPSELQALMSALPELRKASSASIRALADLVPLALHTGCRIEELCALRLENVLDDRLRITEGKNDSAVRDVPLQLSIRPTVARLRAAAVVERDGFLIPRLTAGGRDAKRSHEPSKAFGRFLRRALPGTDGELDFHSLRRSHSQRALSAGVPGIVHDLLAGHREQSMLLLYAQHADFATLAAAVELITWPELSIPGWS